MSIYEIENDYKIMKADIGGIWGHSLIRKSLFIGHLNIQLYISRDLKAPTVVNGICDFSSQCTDTCMIV